MPKGDSPALKIRAGVGREPGEPAAPGKFVGMGLPDEAVVVLNEVMRLTGDTPEPLFRKSPGLDKIAVDAREEGNPVAIVDPDGEPVRDIAGV